MAAETHQHIFKGQNEQEPEKAKGESIQFFGFIASIK